MASAEYICEANGWEFDGELIATIPAPELEDYITEVQNQLDRDWLEGQKGEYRYGP